MNNIVDLKDIWVGAVSRVSTQVSEFSEKNGGTDAGGGTIFAVETLFLDGKWVTDGHFRSLIEAKDKAKQVSDERGSDLLTESIWPNRKVTS